MALKLFEFLEQTIGTFSITLTKFEKTGSKGKFLFHWQI